MENKLNKNKNRQRLMENVSMNIRLRKYERHSKYAKPQMNKEIKCLEEIREEQTVQNETHAMITIWILSRYQPHVEEQHRQKETNYHKASKNQPTRIIQNDKKKKRIHEWSQVS